MATVQEAGCCEFCSNRIIRLTVRWLTDDQRLSDYCRKSLSGFHKPKPEEPGTAETTTQAAIQQIDLTGQRGYMEVLTGGGIIRVNVGLEDIRTRRPVVVVEVEPYHPLLPRTSGGGEWDLDMREHFGMSRVDVRLTRKDQGNGRDA